MTPSHYHRLVAALLVCSLLFVPLASADPLVTGSKDDTSTFVYSSNGGISILGKLYTSTAFHIDSLKAHESFGSATWRQDFKMLQGDYTNQIEPPTSVDQPLESITKSYGKVLCRSANMRTTPVTSEEDWTGGAPVNNKDDKKLADLAINLATTMTSDLFTKTDPTGVLALVQNVKKYVNILAPIFTSSSSGERWTVEFDHKTGSVQTLASTSSHYITFETFTLPNQDQITSSGHSGNSFKTKEDLIRAGTKPACFEYESGVEVKSSVLTVTNSKNFVFVRGKIPPGVDPSDPGYRAQHSFKLAPDGKSCNTDTGEVPNRFTRNEPALSPQKPVIGDELEQVLEDWGTPAA